MWNFRRWHIPDAMRNAWVIQTTLFNGPHHAFSSISSTTKCHWLQRHVRNNFTLFNECRCILHHRCPGRHAFTLNKNDLINQIRKQRLTCFNVTRMSISAHYAHCTTHRRSQIDRFERTSISIGFLNFSSLKLCILHSTHRHLLTYLTYTWIRSGPTARCDSHERDSSLFAWIDRFSVLFIFLCIVRWSHPALHSRTLTHTHTRLAFTCLRVSIQNDQTPNRLNL